MAWYKLVLWSWFHCSKVWIKEKGTASKRSWKLCWMKILIHHHYPNKNSYFTCYLRVAFLVATWSVRCIKVVQAGILLTVKENISSILLLLMISLSLLTVNYFVKPACAGVSHCWCMSPHAIPWANGQRNREEQMFPTTLIQKLSSIVTLLPTHPSLEDVGYIKVDMFNK
jgi:hypothetical protein